MESRVDVGLPSNHLCILANSNPVTPPGCPTLEPGCQPIAVWFGVYFVSHFDQQRHVLSHAKPGIQAEVSVNRASIRPVLCLELLQPLLQLRFLRPNGKPFSMASKLLLELGNLPCQSCLPSPQHTQLVPRPPQEAVRSLLTLFLFILRFELADECVLLVKLLSSFRLLGLCCGQPPRSPSVPLGLAFSTMRCRRLRSRSVRRKGRKPVLASAARTIASTWVHEAVLPG